MNDAIQEPVTVEPLGDTDLPDLGNLHERVFGPGRFARTAYRIREGAPAISPHCQVARRGGQLVGSVTMTAVRIGTSHGHWLLGPLAVQTLEAGQGVGRALVEAATGSAMEMSETDCTVILVGDLAYYERLGFLRVPPGQIVLPGPADPARILARTATGDASKLPQGLVQADR